MESQIKNRESGPIEKIEESEEDHQEVIKEEEEK